MKRAIARGLLVVALAIHGPACATATSPAPPVQRVLFIGNSVTYTNNLPARFAELARAQGGEARFEVDLLARGGATLAQFADDPVAVERITSGDYAAVVLQERGGDDLCVLDAADRAMPDCQRGIDAHVRLASMARDHGAVVAYLGTYQFVPGASQALVAAERELAEQMHARHLSLSERLRVAREGAPDLPWIDADGAHPGVATTELMAALLYDSLSGSPPKPATVCTTSASYPPGWKHAGLVSHRELLSPVSAERCLLDARQMKRVLRAAEYDAAPAGSRVPDA